MSTPKFIDKKQELNAGLDYEFLKREGLKHVQNLAGENWTDFNAHDPGVTILEQLAYALTDLGYKSNLDFKDLLASQQKIGENDTLFSVSNILPTNPITIQDYRKIIIDRVNDLDNIWIQPLNSFTRRKNIKGLYLAFIELNPQTRRAEEEVRAEVKKDLNFYSNLCETFEDVVVLKKQEIYLKCEIELDKNVNAESIHAQVLFELEQFITKPLRFYSLNEMLDRGFEINDIFDGPRLKNGFIKDEFLKEKDTVFFNSQIMNTMRKIKGIKAIKSFNLLVESKDKQGNVVYKDYVDELSNKTINEIVVIKWENIAVLGSKIYTEVSNRNFFSYTNDKVAIHLQQKEVDRYLNVLRANVKVRFSKNFKQENDLPIPKGNKLPIVDYYSIQQQFPKIYGLSENDISGGVNRERKSQIYQLKGYLLFFEQIMANYLEQLSRFNELYSLDQNLTQSYFVQIPWDIPGMYHLVGGLDKEKDNSQFENDFKLAVSKIMEGIDNFYERREQFVNHLLSRFGDYSFNYSFDKFNYYHSKEEHKRSQLNNSLNILQNYNWLSINKARSFDHTSKFWDDELIESKLEFPNLSTLEYRIRMKTGLQTDSVPKIGSDLAPKVNFEGIAPLTNFHLIVSSFSNVSFYNIKEQFQGLWLKKGEFGKVNDEALIKDISINEDLFKRGIWEENIRIVKDSSSEKESYLLLFKKKVDPIIIDDLEAKFTSEIKEELKRVLANDEHDEVIEVLMKDGDKEVYCFQFEKNISHAELHPSSIWKVLHSCDNEDLAFKTAFSLKNNLIGWNKSSEGFYLLDHILLRPIKKEVLVNILLNDPNSDWSFRLSTGYKMGGIETGIRSDIKKMRKLPFQLVQRDKYYIITWKENGNLIGRCNQKYESEIEAGRKAAEIQVYFNNFSDLDIHDTNRVKFKREIEDSVHPLHHYSFTLTVFLSKWTARFSDPEFQYLLESLFRKNIPAHIGVHFKWLDLMDMVTFEEIYDVWLVENRKEELNHEVINQISESLLTFAKVI